MSDVLAKAKAGLILDQPFFASILLSLPLIKDESIPTFATNGDEIRYNPKFLDSLTLPEVTFVLAHETMHCVFQHMHRREDRTPKRWNVAGDYVINDLLHKENVGIMPSVGLLDPKLVQDGGGTAEGVYKLLPDESEIPETGDEGGSLDTVSDAGKDEAEIAQKQAEMKVKIIQAKNAAKMMGKLSAGVERWVDEAVKTQNDWRSLLRRFLSERAKVDLSYAKPKRRFLSEDMIIPSLIGERLGVIAVAVDCSGSINTEVLNAFEAEIKAIFEDTRPTEIKIVYFDSEVLRVDTVLENDEVKLKPIGGGGTAFSPIFECLNDLETVPTACVVLTDLCCNDFGDVPPYPVLWATTDACDKVPFGEIVELKGEF